MDRIEIPDAIAQAIADGLAASIPEIDAGCSEWAAKYRHVSPERSSRPGLWSNDTVPFLVDVMDAASDPSVRRVVLKKSSQVAGSELLVNYICYRIHTSPTMIIYCAESEDKANQWSYESFDTAVEVSPEIKKRIKGRKGSEDNNQKRKKFPGGLLTIVYASSAAQLSSRPAEVAIMDEVDACVKNSEGSPVVLLEARTKTFSDTKKIILVSSPRDKATSVICKEYEESDQRNYYVPCPHCGEFQVLKWSNVRWDDEPLDAYYVCDIGGCVIEQFEKEQMLLDGEWRASKPFRGSAGFQINEMYSPFTNWGSMANDFLKAKHDPTMLQAFINTQLGEAWESEGEKVDYAEISFNREDYEAEVPDGVILLTAAVDVQDDRLECEVVGWGYDLESWSIDYRVFIGDPANKELWSELKDFLTREFINSCGQVLKIKATGVDSGGHHTQSVYKFCKENSGRRFWALKGRDTVGTGIVSKPSWTDPPNRTRLWKVGTVAAKDMIFAFLKVQEEGPGFWHFPDSYEDEYFKMLCAETKKTKFTSGKERRYYAKISEKARNEALDLKVYNLAAYHILNPDLKSFEAALRRKRPASNDPSQNKTDEADINQTAAKPVKNKPKSGFIGRKRSGFVKNW